MSDNHLGAELIVQVAVVVRDIQSAVASYARLFDLPEVEIRETRDPAEAQTQYRGRATDGRAKLAFFRMGQVAVELIEPIGGPSAWQEFLDEHGPGVHHIAFEVPDLEPAEMHLREKGVEIVQQGRFRSGRYLYADTTPQLGVMMELLQIYKGH
jgi:methylmalonyl-CoA/ethylmalonyl-CoA epimerase